MLTTDQKGAVAELAIAREAIRLGLGVYRPLVEGGRYDLILEADSALVRVQCKWATTWRGAVIVRCYSARRGRTGMIVRKYTAERSMSSPPTVDVDRVYVLTPREFAGRRQVHLRFAPSRNKQQLRINRAEDFEFGARLGAFLGP